MKNENIFFSTSKIKYTFYKKCDDFKLDLKDRFLMLIFFSEYKLEVGFNCAVASYIKFV